MVVAKNILVVEDNEPAQRQLKTLLENHGYKVMIAPDDNLALPMLREKSDIIDLILLDIIMPASDTGGIELLQKIREMEGKKEIRPEIPVIFVTVKSETEVKREVTKYGKKVTYEGFIKKPLSGKKIDSLLDLTQRFVTDRKNRYLKKLDNLINLLLDTKISFSDKIDRRLFFSDFKIELKELWRNREAGSQYMAQVIDLLFRALRFTRPEDLMRVKQIDNLLQVANKLKRLDMNRDDARECGKILRDSGFRTLPQLGEDES